MTEVHISSDGTGGSTRITTASGQELKAVKAVVNLEVNSANTVELELWLPSVDIKATPHVTNFNCPCCGEIMYHNCQGAP